MLKFTYVDDLEYPARVVMSTNRISYKCHNIIVIVMVSFAF